MSAIEITEELRRFAFLFAALNKSGLDTKLTQLGQSLISGIGDSESITMEEDLEKVRILFENYKEEANKPLEKTQLKDKKKVRAYVDGCFDLMHAGHYNSLRQASKLGDELVCGINSDLEVTLVKGPPVFNVDERWTVAGACKWVDEIAPDTEYTPTADTLDEYNWDFYAHGDDIALNSDGIDSAHELQSVGRFKLFKRTRGVSTTDIAAKLLAINDEAMRAIKEGANEEEKMNSSSTSNTDQSKIPKILGSYNANPHFMASAKRIAQFCSMREQIETDKVVYVDGGFDICHPGHIELLKKARELGDYLIVGIHEDQCVNQYLGSQYPLNSLHERVLNILAWKYVDDVIIGAPFKITERLIQDLNISVVVESLDVIQGNILSQALDLKPYEVPRKLGLMVDVEIHSTLTLKEIAKRVADNREAIAKKVLSSSFKQDEFEKNSKFICEVR